MAEVVGSHMLMAAQLVDTDPELAYRHAEAARRRAARLPVCREIAGETAYAAGKYAVALNEFRALRRMLGGTEYLAAMADCERALGRPQQALKLIAEGLDAGVDFPQRVELRLVEAGVRLDMGQPEEALRLLRSEIESAAGRGTREARTRLRYGYADMLEKTGNAEEAERWFAAAAALDTDGLTDADDRVARLQGMVLEIVEEDLVGYPEPEGETAEGEGADDATDEPKATGEDAAQAAPAAESTAGEEPAAVEPGGEASEAEPQGVPEEPEPEETPDTPGAEASFISSYDSAFFDLDGVIYLGAKAVEGAVSGVERLHRAGVRTIFVTNNAARAAQTVADHLVELGFEASVDDVVTSAQAATSMLARDLPAGSRVLVAGTQNLVNLVEEAGMVPVTRADEEPDAVIQGYDPEMTFPRMDQAALAVQRGARWYACNTDSSRPTEHGLVPGAGVAVMAVRNTVDFDPIVAGKPYRPLLEEAMRRTGAERPVFVGDRIDTDIIGAVNVGMDSFMVFTGAHGKADLIAAPDNGRPTAIGWDVPAMLEPARTAQVGDGRAVCRGVVARVTGGVVALSGDLSDRESQLDALWAVAQLVWADPELDSQEAMAQLDLIP
jgi:HAD superfamily hydrolase (TIGR01450 family)